MFLQIKERIKPVVLNLIKNAWLVKKEENILIISDFPATEDLQEKDFELLTNMYSRNLLARVIFEIIKENQLANVNLFYMKPTYQHYVDPMEKNLIKMAQSSNIILALTQYSLTLSHSFKKLLEEKKIKFISAPMVPIEIFYPGGPLDVDFWKVRETTEKLYLLLSNATEINIQYITGTDLKIKNIANKEEWYCETGVLTEYGSFTNLPAGEVGVGLARLKDICEINGVLVVFPGFHEGLSDTMKLIIRNNKLIDVIGGGNFEEVLKSAIRQKKNDVLDFGIGTNPRALNPFCPTVADKLLGMVHLSFAFDLTRHFYSPIGKIILDGKEYSRMDIFGLLEEV